MSSKYLDGLGWRCFRKPYHHHLNLLTLANLVRLTFFLQINHTFPTLEPRRGQIEFGAWSHFRKKLTKRLKFPAPPKPENGVSPVSLAPWRRCCRGSGVRMLKKGASTYPVDGSPHSRGAHLCRLVPGSLDLGRVPASGGAWPRPSCCWCVRLPRIDSAVHRGVPMVGRGALTQLLAA